ncbi:response regulator [Desulfatitalea alkaliphila]|uniref:Response regulator n=1 Tax=Desulfatitalea alkaliphila TaxID=2929485 RepID=A0AA41USE1_9BACT|nr:response regulator [Desulfatitalea alkaliphila]MCJ8503188.1 response regulator [Desulfatitalea alkaliphila]
MEKPIRIMVVDDEQSICRNVEKILTKNNYQVTCATSADEALTIMAQNSFELVISDIVMPKVNGLELLKSIKTQWPDTKAVMMTAYASTDTAMKAIRLGALDYLPKPFTPKELRNLVDQALAGKLIEAKVSEAEKKAITVIDVDIPFDPDEVAAATGEAYARSIGPSDMPVVEVRTPTDQEGFCEVGNMICDIFKKLGATCKAGTKSAGCPQLKAKKKKGAAATQGPAVKTLVGIDQPFNYEEVKAVTGPEYLNYLRNDGVAVPTYEELKANVARLERRMQIDVDMPFDHEAVAKATDEIYARNVGRSDIPTVEITADQPMEGFCEVGNMVCDIFKKLGATCKAGTKSAGCPQLKAKKKKSAAAPGAFDPARMIGIDLPFDYKEVAAATGPEYVAQLETDGIQVVPYAQLKANYAKLTAAEQTPRLQVITNKVLVIDDEVAVNNNIRKILGKKKYTVDQATTKEEALSKIEAGDYSLVLLDLRIPGVKDLELLAAIRQHKPDAQVIIITGYASIETAKEAARMGAMDYLPKPFTPNEIRNATDRAMQLAA